MADEEYSLIKFHLPRNFLIVGATQSGKTEFIKKLLINREKMFTQIPSRVIYVYSVWQDKYQEILESLGPVVEFRTDIPSKSELCQIWEEFKSHTILVLDDKMNALDNGPSGANVIEIATVLCHHAHVSLIATLHNLFHPTKAVREISLNSQYICLFRNDRSAGQVRALASQTMPANMAYFLDSYEKATSPNFGYLIIDLSPQLENKKYQLRTNVFPGDQTTVYLPKK